MKNRIILVMSSLIILAGLSSCSLESGSPEAAYQRFKSACDRGDTATAESYATDDAILANREYGICILTHDGLGRSITGTSWFTFTSEDPEVQVSGNTAYLTWWTDTGKEVRVTMYKIGSSWKIKETLIFG